MIPTLDVFSGIGGFAHGLARAGPFTPVQFCERDPGCQRVLATRWPHVPVHDDIQTLPPLSQPVDLICGGFPCQDLSIAGTRNGNLGLAGARSGLWFAFAEIIEREQPAYVLIENVAILKDRGLDQVLTTLAALGYDAEWHCLPATYLGALHSRDRLWIIAHATRLGMEGLWATWLEELRPLVRASVPDRTRDGQWQVEPDLRRSPYGLSSRLDGRLNTWGQRLHQLGNAIVPAFAELWGRAILRHRAASLA